MTKQWQPAADGEHAWSDREGVRVSDDGAKLHVHVRPLEDWHDAFGNPHKRLLGWEGVEVELPEHLRLYELVELGGEPVVPWIPWQYAPPEAEWMTANFDGELQWFEHEPFYDPEASDWVSADGNFGWLCNDNGVTIRTAIPMGQDWRTLNWRTLKWQRPTKEDA